ncbi:MAG: DUF21 domain-containing protein, partial [Clostridia bacterium]|nr:DUF21 domain-containing protein [Clostridia bacterium]
MSDIMLYLSIPLLLLVSAFFSATEIAFASVNAMRLRKRAEERPSLALNWALRINDDYENTLGAILIGNNLANNA